jgi:glycosyltransferase involved in cell wall biosynthesis
MLTLRASRKPYLYDVDDYWIVNELREDPWLFWWNSNNISFQSNVMRRGLEMGGQRDKLDGVAPTRCQMGLERLPEVFSKPQVELEPNSIGVFHFNRLYFCSHALKDATEKAGFRVGHAEVIHPGIPTHQFHGQLKSPEAPFKKLITCCDLHPKNGVMTALEAIQHLFESDHGFTLDIYGRGDSDYVAQLRSFVARHELPVHFMTVSNLSKDMPAIYRLHDAFLHTPEWEEPFSIAPIEAMACGLPVIGTTSGGVGELLKHGQNSFTFTPGNPKDLANRIIEMKEKPQLRCRMADAAQQDVLALFNETTVTDQIENYLNGTIEMWNA